MNQLTLFAADAAPAAPRRVAKPSTQMLLAMESDWQIGGAAPVASPPAVPLVPARAATKARAERFVAMLKGYRPGIGTRAFDNCMEQGDGDLVAAHVLHIIKSSPEEARAIYYAVPKRDHMGRPLIWARDYLNGHQLRVCEEMLGIYKPPVD